MGLTIEGIPTGLRAKYSSRAGQGVLQGLNFGKLPPPSVTRMIVLPLYAGNNSLEGIRDAFVGRYAQLRLDTKLNSQAFGGTPDEAIAHPIMLNIPTNEEYLIEDGGLPLQATVAFALPLKGKFEDRTLETQRIIDEIERTTEGAFEMETLNVDGETFLLVKLPCRQGAREVDFTQQLVIAANQEARERTADADREYEKRGYD